MGRVRVEERSQQSRSDSHAKLLVPGTRLGMIPTLVLGYVPFFLHGGDLGTGQSTNCRYKKQ
eukprot:978746-Rhodomonas_salina.1